MFWDQTLPSVTPERWPIFAARSRRSRNCTATTPRKSGSATSAGPAIISRARSTAGPSSIAPPRPRRSRGRAADRVAAEDGAAAGAGVGRAWRLSPRQHDLSSDQPRVVAVLDWELSTLGDPLADFSYLLMQWVMPGPAVGWHLAELNIPTLEEAEIYCNVAGRHSGPQLVLCLQPVPPDRHPAGHRGTDSRRHGGQRESDGVGQAHGATVERRVGLRAEGRRGVRARARRLLGMISAQTRCVCREGKPLHTSPDHV